MNPQTPESKILQTFKDSLARAYPHRVATRVLKDFADRETAQLKKGVFSVIAKEQTGGDVYESMLSFLVVGQCQLNEKSSGEDIEEFELTMAREIKNLVQRQTQGPVIRITNIAHSNQVEAPYGWISAQLECGPYDATEPLTTDEVLGHLTDFLTFHSDIDLSNPHNTNQEHQMWLQEPPVHSVGEPDAELRVDIPRSPV